MTYARKNYTKKKTKKTRRKTTRTNLTKTIKNEIDRTLNRKAEKKETGMDPELYLWNGNNATMSPAVDLTKCLQIPQGTSNGTRIGDSINVTNATLKLVVRAPVDTGPVILQLFIGKLKPDPSKLPDAINLSQIFEDGAITKPADGTFSSLLRSVNKNLFTIYNYKKIKIGVASHALPAYSNNDFNIFKLMKIPLKSLMGKATYSIDGGTVTNKNLFMFCNFVNLQGVAVSGIHNPVIEYWVDLEYNDL